VRVPDRVSARRPDARRPGQGGDVLDREPLQLEPQRVPPRQRLPELPQRTDGFRVSAPGADDGERAARVLDEVLQQPQCRGVRPVQVVEHQEQRAAGRGGRHREHHRVEEPEPVDPGRGAGGVVHEGAQVGNAHLRHRLGEAAQNG
jgi:hypothetical protein